VKQMCIEGSSPGRNVIYSALQVTRPAQTAVLEHTPTHQVGLGQCYPYINDHMCRLDLSEQCLRVWVERLKTQSG
jgi:hypothetical protein